MTDQDLRSALWVEAHPKLLNEAFMEAVEKTYLTYIGLGLQTLNPETMKNINRPWDPEKIGALLDRLAVNKSCLLGLEIIMGLPGDNLEDFKKALTWVYRKEPTNVFAFNLDVLPQTPLHRDAERFGIKEGGPESYHEIISNHTFPADQIMVGKAMTAWNRQMQPIFYRLAKVTGLPAGDLIEGWAWAAYHAGLHEHLNDLHENIVEGPLLNRMADLFETRSAELLVHAGLPDVSKMFREAFRYYFIRRSVSPPSTDFIDALDVHCITTDPKYNRIMKQDFLEGKPHPDGARKESFAFDMERLWNLTDAGEMHRLEPDPHTYLFFPNERGAPVIVEMN